MGAKALCKNAKLSVEAPKLKLSGPVIVDVAVWRPPKGVETILFG